MESKHVSKFSKALQGQFNKDGKLTGTGEIKYKNGKNKITDDDGFEESVVNKDSDDFKFDIFAEALQDIVIEEEFEKMQNCFYEKCYKVFEDKDENKQNILKYLMDILKQTEEFLEKIQKKVSRHTI